MPFNPPRQFLLGQTTPCETCQVYDRISAAGPKLRTARKKGLSAQISRHMERCAALRQAAAALLTVAPTSSSGVGRLGDGGCCDISRRSMAVGVEEVVPIEVRVGCDLRERGDCHSSQSWSCKSLRAKSQVTVRVSEAA